MYMLLVNRDTWPILVFLLSSSYTCIRQSHSHGLECEAGHAVAHNEGVSFSSWHEFGFLAQVHSPGHSLTHQFAIGAAPSHHLNPLHGAPFSLSSPYVNFSGMAGTWGMPRFASGTTRIGSVALLRERRSLVLTFVSGTAAAAAATRICSCCWHSLTFFRTEDRRIGMSRVRWPGSLASTRLVSLIVSLCGGGAAGAAGAEAGSALVPVVEKLRRERMLRREPMLRSLGKAAMSRDVDLRSLRGVSCCISSSSLSESAARLVPREEAALLGAQAGDEGHAVGLGKESGSVAAAVAASYLCALGVRGHVGGRGVGCVTREMDGVGGGGL